jgi:hypothetical protein
MISGRRQVIIAAAAVVVVVVAVIAFAATRGSTPTPVASPTATPTPTPTPTPTATPTAHVVYGTSFGGLAASAVAATVQLFPNAKVGRYYYPESPPVFGGTIATIPAGWEIWVSFKAPVAEVDSGAFDAAFATVLKSWIASGRTIKWTWQHEADDPKKGITPAQYVAGWRHLLSVAAANPAPSVKSMSILTAKLLADGQPHGNPDAWYVPADYLGYDCYQLANEAPAITYAAAKGKPVAFPEVGASIAGSSDAESLGFLQSFVAAFTPNVYGMAWYNALGNELASKPQTLAYLKQLAGP